VARFDDTLFGYDPEGRERWRRTIPSSFGLARRGAGVVVAVHQVGLEELDGATGVAVRSWAVPEILAPPDPYASSLGALRIAGDVAFVEAGATLHAVPLEGAARPWREPGVGVQVGDDAVYVCRGGRARALDRETGVERWSFSLSGCRMVGLAGTRLLVGYHAYSVISTSPAPYGGGVIAFDRHAHATACEVARFHGTVTVDHRLAPGIGVTAGLGWATAQTDANGRFALELCDQGLVPVALDEEEVVRFGGKNVALEIERQVWLEGRGDYEVDFTAYTHSGISAQRVVPQTVAGAGSGGCVHGLGLVCRTEPVELRAGGAPPGAAPAPR
jgi:hypothetical protein